MILLIRTRCKIRFIYVHKIQLQKKKKEKTIVGRGAIRRGGEVERLIGRVMFFSRFLGTLPLDRICTLLLVKNTC